jgi:hypothetical protein
MWSEGFAPYLSYPLINGFSITGSGWIWTTSADIANYKPLHIAFYGIIMLFGVCVSYWVCDHKFYQEFHKHGILDTLVIIAFPAGVIGARIWYVVGNWNREFASPVANRRLGFDLPDLGWGHHDSRRRIRWGFSGDFVPSLSAANT